MSKANNFVFYAHCDLHAVYVLGNEAFVDKDYEPSKDPLASDCSGLVIGCCDRAGIRFNGVTLSQLTGWQRPNAERLRQVSTKISQPTRIGDLGFLLRSDGSAHHVFIYVGKGCTIESGDGTHQTAKHTVEWQNHRGATWRRLPGNDIGELTDPSTSGDIDWPALYGGKTGRYVREYKTIINYLYPAAGLTLKDNDVGNMFGTSCAWWGAKFQKEHPRLDGKAFRASGVIGPETRKALVKAVLKSY